MSRARIHIDFVEGFFDEVLNSPNVRAQVDLAANRMLAEARATAPVDSGRYRDSLHIEHVMHEHRQTALVVADSDNAMLVESQTGNLARARRKAKA